MKEYKILGPAKQIKKLEWRHLFTEEQLKSAADRRKVLKVVLEKPSYYSHRFRSASVTVDEPAARSRTRIYRVNISSIPSDFSDSWSSMCFSCSCRGSDLSANGLCLHEAAAMLALEKEYGGSFTAEESDWAHRRRLEQEEQYLRILEYRDEMIKANHDYFPVSRILSINQEGLLLYDLAGAVRNMVTNNWAVWKAQEMNSSRIHVKEVELRNGSKFLSAEFAARDSATELYFSCACTLAGNEISRFSCDCEFHEMDSLPEHALCPHQLTVLRGLRDYIQKQMPSDLTDEAARKFFAQLHSAQTKSEKKDANKEPVRSADVLLAPRIVTEDGIAQVSFKLGRKGGKMLVLRNLRDLLRAYENKARFELSKTEVLDFAKLDFAPEAGPWLTFIQRRVTELEDVNEKLYMRSNPWKKPVSLAITAQQPLSGAVLDQFYELAEGQFCEYTDKTNEIKGVQISVGHTKMRFTLTIDQIVDTAGQFAGITVSGMIPVMLEGASHFYILNQHYLSRMEVREMEVLEPFRAVADASGLFRFRVGREHLQEFYYRALPSLLENPFVSIVDHGNGEPQKYLPPEPQFRFYLDLTEDMQLICRCSVTYEERICELNSKASPGEYRDEEQESRIRAMLKEEFSSYNPRSGSYLAQMTDDSLYDFLMNGISRLEKYGDVHGTEAFKRKTVKPFSSVQVGVSVRSGLMDITVTSRDYSQKELLEILDSYQKKKRYYRLKRGDYVDLSDNAELEDMTAFFGGLDLMPTDALKKQIHLPLYRALYLDRMLEEHNGLASTRDRTYRALIKNFQTIRDADWEVPSGLENILRPYQVYGYKWLKTLEDAGFGGILADEMGLGKTIQMISLFQNDAENGASLPSLVVCPASLVYNWQAEINRFAPNLKVQTITGTTAVRKGILEEICSYKQPPQSETSTLPAVIAPVPAESAPVPDVSEAPAPKKRGRKPKARVTALDAVTEETLAVSPPKKQGCKTAEAGISVEPADVYITSYDLLKRDIGEYESLRFNVFVLDEAQYIKNQTAAAAKSVKLIHAEHRFALTGTPIENRLSELWSIFDFLMPGFLYRSEEFIKRFEQPISRNQDEEMTARLKKMTSPFILRRLKADVLKDLPPKLEEVHYARFEGEQQKLYDAQVVHMTQMIHASSNSGEDKIRILAELTRIRQICCDPSLLFENYRGGSAKREACMDLVRSAIDGGHRILIFSQFTSMLALLEEDLKKAGIDFFRITGATPKETRISLVNQFNEGETPVFLVSLKAGGTGLNLTGADVVIHYDPWWNLAAQNQATDRAHRIGQTRQVTVYRMIARDTIEEKILELQEAKQDLADAILEGRSESLMSLSSEELLSLLNG